MQSCEDSNVTNVLITLPPIVWLVQS